MLFESVGLSPDERISLKLRELYESFGYVKYRMNRFEDYDLYAANRDFLPDGSIITFTDQSGALLAMKPDVTLSIANGLPSGVPVSEKIYYNENVYRMPSGGREYKEIMQLGVECIGDTDLCSICEVILLAIKSMSAITDDYILDITHIGFVNGLLESTGLSADIRERLIGYISRKDAHDITRLCRENGAGAKAEERIRALTGLYAPIGEALALAEELDVNTATHAALKELKSIYEVMSELGLDKKLYLDFSFADNAGYYDGVKFRGFVEGIYSAVLAGGSYGKLLKKLKKQAGAIGFAVYLDALKEYGGEDRDYDADTLILYSDDSQTACALTLAERASEKGGIVRVSKSADGIRCAATVRVGEGETC